MSRNCLTPSPTRYVTARPRKARFIRTPLVAATAAEHGIVLATRDSRAADTYRALEVDFELIT
jgi:predicted nucleic acid-binding protein